jgi:hypothetical protein
MLTKYMSIKHLSLSLYLYIQYVAINISSPIIYIYKKECLFDYNDATLLNIYFFMILFFVEFFLCFKTSFKIGNF